MLKVIVGPSPGFKQSSGSKSAVVSSKPTTERNWRKDGDKFVLDCDDDGEICNFLLF
jgi:hypothetical protein